MAFMTRHSCSQDPTDTSLITYMDASLPQDLPWRLWTPPIELVSVIFCAATINISEGLSDSQAAAADGHWTKWAEFCQDVDLDTLLFLYRDLVPILNTFARQYRTGALTPRGRQVQPRTV